MQSTTLYMNILAFSMFSSTLRSLTSEKQVLWNKCGTYINRLFSSFFPQGNRDAPTIQVVSIVYETPVRHCVLPLSFIFQKISRRGISNFPTWIPLQYIHEQYFKQCKRADPSQMIVNNLLLGGFCTDKREKKVVFKGIMQKNFQQHPCFLLKGAY